MTYEVVMPYHLHMPSYFLGTFTEYPYASPIKNKTTSLSFALFVLLVHNFLLSLGLQLLTYKLAYYETSMWS